MFLPHFDVFCDLLLDRCTATWNLFVNGNHTVFEFNLELIWTSEFSKKLKLHEPLYKYEKIRAEKLSEDVS